MRMHRGRLYVQPTAYDALHRGPVYDPMRIEVQRMAGTLPSPSPEQLAASLPGLSDADALELAHVISTRGVVDVVVGDVPEDQ